MIRPLLWLLAGVVLGGIIHIIVILTLPALAEQSVWSRVAALEADNRMLILPRVVAGEPNPLGMDPELAYGLCRVDLGSGRERWQAEDHRDVDDAPEHHAPE